MYKVDTVVWVIDNGSPKECKIESVESMANDVMYKLYDRYSKLNTGDLYLTQKNCQIAIGNKLSQAEFKIGDIVALLKDTYTNKKIIRNVNMIQDIRLGANGVQYKLFYPYEDYYENNIQYELEENLVKIKDEYIHDNLQVSELMQEYKHYWKKMNKIKKLIGSMTDGMEKNIGYAWENPKKKSKMFWGEVLYDKVFEE